MRHIVRRIEQSDVALLQRFVELANCTTLGSWFSVKRSSSMAISSDCPPFINTVRKYKPDGPMDAVVSYWTLDF